MNVIDLFAGVGGLSQGFIKAGFSVILANEYDSEIADSYRYNHPETKVILEDIRTINLQDWQEYLEKTDVVVGGPPCQGFSQKGKRLNLNDDRNFMFKYFIDVVSLSRPEFFLLENVPNIISTSDGFFKRQIIEQFNDLGYDVTTSILNASDFGVPQHRRRAFFLGQKQKLDIALPVPNGVFTSVKDAIYDLPFIASGGGMDFYEYVDEPLTEYQRERRKGSDGIYNHFATKHSALALKRLSLIPKGKGKEVLPAEHRTKSIYSGTWSRLIEDQAAATITTRFDTPSSGLFTHPILDRCLTVREAARIQSFDDKFIFVGNKSSQMKQVGNAVPPLLAYNIALPIFKILTNKNECISATA
jgi:DNA (cytosine-5)-methyltransferase 1